MDVRRPACNAPVERSTPMLGIEDPLILAAYLLCLASTVLCVVYGALNWNKGDESLQKEDLDWADEEKSEVEEAL
jgi:hypothetical protein